MPAEKIATCCYCGTRAALVLTGRERHELACSRCGAPLHDLKQMPGKRRDAGPGTGRRGAGAPRAMPARPAPKPAHPKAGWENPGRPRRKTRKGKGRKRMKKIFEELFDLVEDIID